MTTAVPLSRGTTVYWDAKTGDWKVSAAVTGAGKLECAGGAVWTGNTLVPYAVSAKFI